MKKIYLLLLAFNLTFITFSQSPITAIDRANITGPTNTGVAANISALGFTRGTGISASNNTNFSARDWDAASLATAQAANDYIQWSISANSSYNIDVTSINIALSRNNQGPQNWQILYSLDGFTTAGLPLSAVQSAATTAATNYTLNTVLNSGNTGTITFRLYAWNAGNSNAGTFTIEGQTAWAGFGVTNPGVRISGNINSSPANSAESNIIATGFNPTDNINYLSYSAASGLSTANAIKIGEFRIQDGGNDLTDADNLPTILTEITFNVTGASNIAALAIFDGVTNVSENTLVSSSTTFSAINSGLGITAPDGGTKTFSIYATFNTAVTDNEQLQLAITNAIANAILGSSFETVNAGGASTPISGDDNRIEVTRSRLIFGQQPSDVILFEIMTPAPTVLGVDINSNLDLDYNGFIVIGSALTIDGSSTIFVAASSGVAVFDNLVFSEEGVDNLTATPLDAGIIVGVSTSFTVSMPAFDGLIYSSNAWSPSAPTNGTGSVNALVLNGTYTVTSDVAINNLIIDDAANVVVESGKSLQVNGDLTCNNNVLLDSDSLEYSSLIVNGSVSCNIVYSRHVNTNASVGGNDLISSPVFSSENFGEFAANNSNIFSNPSNPTEKLFGPYDKTTGLYLTYDTNIPGEAAATLDSGVGYRAASTDGLNFNFTGSVVLTDVTVPIVISGPFSPEWNLVGNPYPSYITLSDFLAANNSQFAPISSGVYGYDGNASDGWQIWNQAYSDANPDAVITPGQGFLVTSAAASGSILFTPAMRTTGTSDDFIPGRMQNPNISHLALKLENSNNNQFKTDFYFTDNASLGLDPGYDSQIFSGLTPQLSIYSQLVEENTGINLGVQSIGNFNLADVSIPLGVNAIQGQQVTISIAETTLPQGTDVFLEDTVTNIITELTTNDYVFTPSSNLSGTGRFFLRFSEQSLSNQEFDMNSLLVYATLTPKVLFIKGQLDDVTSVKIFDIQGRLVLSSTIEAGNTNNQIDISNLKTGIYAVSVTNNSMTKRKKIIIK